MDAEAAHGSLCAMLAPCRRATERRWGGAACTVNAAAETN
jgi:hypothetical protein